MQARAALGGGPARLGKRWRFVVEATVAASVAFFISARLLEHHQPFFAPAAALLVLGAARGQRRGRAIEVVIGVATGVLVADLIASRLGPGTTLTVAVVIAATSVAAILVGAATPLLMQALATSVYVAVVTPAFHGPVPDRFVDALVGGVTALAVTSLLGPRDPLGPATRAAQALYDEVAAILKDVTAALRSRDEAAARAALDRARDADAYVDRLRAAADAAHESIWLVYRSSERTERLDEIERAAVQCDYLVRNVRVLARSAVGLLRLGSPARRELLDAVDGLAASLSLLSATGVDHQLVEDARVTALAAVSTASTAVPDGLSLPQVTLVGQVRAAALDVLRASGLPDRDSIDRIDAAMVD
ncbi:MAG TPA: FUSC family protein [Candidatus Nanopelagicales bacterium]|nr:FUSC family protein [Candidatus Nanopelagicales bacterium]